MESTTAIILGYLGVALMVGLSGVASCIGTSIAGMASVGAMKKNGGAFLKAENLLKFQLKPIVSEQFVYEVQK